jgi:hypothetical protein
MINLDALKRFDPTTIDLSKLDLRNVALPRFDMPRFDMPELQNVELPVDADRIAGFARDAAYVGVGAVVVTAQQADERLRGLASTVSARVRQVVDAVR